ncbi:4471_t:CDS:1, partial [Paraglomus occultum]
KIRCDGIEYHLEWENKKIDIPTRLLCKIITNAKIGANWREMNPIRALEPETENTRHNWSSFWKEMNRTKESIVHQESLVQEELQRSSA